MKRLIGFVLFWIAVGMIIRMMLPNDFTGLVMICVLMLVGYNLFCS
jgi:hypothetical protein